VKCAPGLHGPFCELCVRTNLTELIYYDKADSDHVARCSACNDLVSYSLLTGFAVAAGGAAVVTSAGLILRRLPRSMRIQIVRYWLAAKLETKFKIIWGFYAIVTKVETVYEVILPPKVEAILALISFTIDLGMGSFTSVMTCVDLRGFETRLVFWMLLPPVLIGVILFGTTVRLCYEQRLSREAFAQVSAHPMLVVTFIFYPLIANVAFEAFSCHESLDGHRYLMADVAIDCGSDYYKQVNRLAWLAVFIYVFGVFGVVCLLLFCARKAITRQTPTLLSSSLAFLYREYEPWAFWWELAEMLRRVTLVGFFVLFQPRGSIVQLVAGTTFTAIYLFVQMQAGPYLELPEDYLANSCSFLILAYFLCCLVYKIGALTDQPIVNGVMSLEERLDFKMPWENDEFTWVVGGSVLGAIILALCILGLQLASERARLKREASNRLPTCRWQLKGGQRYVCFLSHFKAEAAAEARYLKDALDHMTGCHAYLDSSTLADLRELFASGVDVSEVLVLMLTPGLLTRPWCLLEIRRAMRESKPIVLLELKGPGRHFSFEEAFALMSNLQKNMPPRNPWCIDELYAHLGDESLTSLQTTVKHALDIGRASKVCQLNIDGTANHLEAELVDLVECFAAVTDRECPRWHGGRQGDLVHFDGRPSHAKISISSLRLAMRRVKPVRTIAVLKKRLSSRRADSTGSDIAEHSRGPTRKKSGRGASSEPSVVRETAYLVHSDDNINDALRLREGFKRVTGKACHAKVPTDVDGMVSCLKRLRKSRCVMLLQTADVLSHPWALLATYTACVDQIPLLCVVVEDAGYDFGEARAYLEHLEEHLNDEARDQMMQILTLMELPPDLDRLKKVLVLTIPNIISVVYAPDGTTNGLIATVHDILDKRTLLRSRIKREHTRCLSKMLSASSTNLNASKGSGNSLASSLRQITRRRSSNPEAVMERAPSHEKQRMAKVTSMSHSTVDVDVRADHPVRAGDTSSCAAERTTDFDLSHDPCAI